MHYHLRLLLIASFIFLFGCTKKETAAPASTSSTKPITTIITPTTTATGTTTATYTTGMGGMRAWHGNYVLKGYIMYVDSIQNYYSSDTIRDSSFMVTIINDSNIMVLGTQLTVFSVDSVNRQIWFMSTSAPVFPVVGTTLVYNYANDSMTYNSEMRVSADINGYTTLATPL